MNKKLLGTQIQVTNITKGIDICTFYKNNGYDLRGYTGYARTGYYGLDFVGLFFHGNQSETDLKTITLEEAEELVKTNDNVLNLEGRWLKALEDRPQRISLLKKGDYAQIDNYNTFIRFSNNIPSTGYLFTYPLDCWELMPEGFEPETTITNTFGLKVGDILPSKILSLWSEKDLNYYNGENWSKGSSSFIKDRKIGSFKILNGILGFEVSSTIKVYLKAEGFKEFMDNFDKKENPKCGDFEVGKWYKDDIGNFVKFKEIINDIYHCSDWINIEKSKFENYGGGTKMYLPKVDIKEIQPYLPEGHPDKINIIPEYVEYLNTKYKGQIVKVEKWSIGTYVVFVKEGYYGVKHCLTSLKISEIGIIGKISNYYKSGTITTCQDISPYVFEKDLVEWFATKEEAEAFAKTLITKIKLDPQVGDTVITKGYSENYDGRELTITGINERNCCWFTISDGGYFNNGNNFSKYHIIDIIHKKPDTTEKAIKELPDKWCIKTTKDSDVHKWFKKELNRCVMHGESKVAFYHFPEIDGWCTSDRIYKGYSEITIEDFYKYVLHKPSPIFASARIIDKPADFFTCRIGYDLIEEKSTKKITITDIPTTQLITIKLNKKINYLIPKTI